MGQGLFLCIAAGPASALASLAGGAGEHDGRRGHRPGLRGADAHGGARLAELGRNIRHGAQVEVKIRWAVVGNRLIK